MRKNVAGQSLTFTLVNKTTGAAVTTGTVSPFVTVDAGTQSAGGGTVAHEGSGQWSYLPTQAETNGNSVGFLFTHTDAIPVNLQVYPVAFDPTDAADLGLTALTGHVPQTGDAYARIGAAGAGLTALGDARLANLDATVSSRLATAGYTAPDNATITTIAGYVDTEVAAIKAKTDLIPASPAATGDIPTAAAVADAVWDEALSGHVAAGSAGAVLGYHATPLDAGTLVGVAGRVLTLAATAPAYDLAGADILVGGQSARIESYDTGTKAATLDADLLAAPSIGDPYRVYYEAQPVGSLAEGFTGEATATTLTLDAEAAGLDPLVADLVVYVAGQARLITALNVTVPAAPVATVEPPWITLPTVGGKYLVTSPNRIGLPTAERTAIGAAIGARVPTQRNVTAVTAATYDDGIALIAALAAGDEVIAGTSYVRKHLDGTTARTFVLDNATAPTSRT